MEAKNSATAQQSSDDLRRYELQARFARTMGNPARLMILHSLVEADGDELSTSEIIAVTGLSKSALSQHLEKMTSVGLVETRREGRFLRVRLAEPEIGKACDLIGVALAKFAAKRNSAMNSPEDES